MNEIGQVIGFVPPLGLASAEETKRVVIVGAGPVGLVAALELANHGVPSVVIEKRNSIAKESKAICWSKRSLEIFDRIGIGDRTVEKGVIWKMGRTYFRDREIFSIDLLPEDGHKRPAFINLQQYYVEHFLRERAQKVDLIDLRFSHQLTHITPQTDGVKLELNTPEGDYQLETEWLLACDGVRSPIRSMMNLGFEGEFFEDRFLIADIEMMADFPSERRFWFEPPFHDGQSALLHKQPDNIYRIDLQLGPEADPEKERRLEIVIPRIEKVVGTSKFNVEWVSIYKFQCRRMARFLHGRVIFAGDSAHEVSPFGARGGNGGIQDVDNLCWRLAAVVKGQAAPRILESYNEERICGADENLLNSSQTTRFMSPSEGQEKLWRDQLLMRASSDISARSQVNSGRLSVPCVYPTNAPDDDRLPVVSKPGSVTPDAPQSDSFLLDRVGTAPTVIGIGCPAPKVEGCQSLDLEVNEWVRARYLGHAKKAIYLLRPDQVVAARWASECDQESVHCEVRNMWGVTDQGAAAIE